MDCLVSNDPEQVGLKFIQLFTHFGNSDEGFYVGAWNLARKVPAAVASGAALSVLGWAGYMAGEPQSEDVLLALRVMYSLVPSVIFAIALVVALAYPIDRAMHAKIREDLQR